MAAKQGLMILKNISVFNHFAIVNQDIPVTANVGVAVSISKCQVKLCKVNFTVRL